MSISSQLSRLRQAKTDLKTAIEEKGVTVDDGLLLNSYAGKVALIEQLDTTDATAEASDILTGETAYVNGSKVTGTLSPVTIHTGSTTPSSSLGSDGDIYLKL